MSSKHKGILGAIALGLAIPSAASAVMIDDFGVGDQHITLTTVSTMTDSAAGSMIGGQRDIKLEVTNSGDPFDVSKVTAAFGTGKLDFSNDSGVEAILEVTWDAGGAGLGGEDMTKGGLHDSIVVEFLDADLGADMTFVVEDTSGNVSSRTLAISAGPSTQFFMYNNFVPVGAPTDFTMIDSIQMVIDAKASGDYEIDMLHSGTPNPEPVTMALGGMGLGALGVATRRRRTR